MPHSIEWRGAVSVTDQLAAIEYLSLVMDENAAVKIAGDFADAPEDWYRANDILRASRLMYSHWDAEHVAKVQHKIEKGKKLNPILLVRTDDNFDNELVIADGFHRVLAVHQYDYEALCAVRIVGPYPDLGYRPQTAINVEASTAQTPAWVGGYA